MFKWTLYEAGFFQAFNPIVGVFAARTEEHAIKQAQEALNLQALPCEAREIKIEGFTINLVKEGEDVQEREEQPIGERGGASKAHRGQSRAK